LATIFVDHVDWSITGPPEIGNLHNLEKLDRRFSRIETLHPSIGKLQTLKELNLNGTKNLTGISGEIGSLHNLIKLTLISSNISSTIGNLCSLITLDLQCSAIFFALLHYSIFKHQ